MAVSFKCKDGQMIARPARVWSCPLHDRYEEPDDPHYCDCSFCDITDEIACEYCESAIWLLALTDDGEQIYEIVFEGILGMILKEMYVPAIMEQMNSEVLMVRLMQNTDRTQDLA